MASIVLSTPAAWSQAENSTDGGELSFDIPAQTLETALEAFGERSRLQVLYETSLTAGRWSSEVKGRFTRSAALHRLLTGTGLEFTYTASRAFTLQPLPTAARPDPGVARFDRYLGEVQSAVIAALCRESEARPGAFRVAMQFWIGPSGRIEHPRLLGSTGMDRRDAAITGALRRLAFGQTPPADMPQPVTLVLRAGPADGRDECGSAR